MTRSLKTLSIFTFNFDHNWDIIADPIVYLCFYFRVNLNAKVKAITREFIVYARGFDDSMALIIDLNKKIIKIDE